MHDCLLNVFYLNKIEIYENNVIITNTLHTWYP